MLESDLNHRAFHQSNTEPHGGQLKACGTVTTGGGAWSSAWNPLCSFGFETCLLVTISEWRRVTEHDVAKLSFFHTTSLRKIQCLFLSRPISNRDLLAPCQQEDMKSIITRKRCRWIGHMLRKDANSVTKVAIHWTPEGKRKRCRPKTTWRRTVEVEMKKMNHSWGTIQRLANDRQGWRSFVAALNASRHDG